MDAFDKAIAAALERQKADEATMPVSHPERSGEAAKSKDPTPRQPQKPAAVDPWSPEAILRAANEDDDLYDPYSDYMDALARSSYEEPEEDPWR